MQRHPDRHAAGHPDERREWRSLTTAEKQWRLAGMRHAQQLQLTRDARVLRAVCAG